MEPGLPRTLLQHGVTVQILGTATLLAKLRSIYLIDIHLIVSLTLYLSTNKSASMLQNDTVYTVVFYWSVSLLPRINKVGCAFHKLNYFLPNVSKMLSLCQLIFIFCLNEFKKYANELSERFLWLGLIDDCFR